MPPLPRVTSGRMIRVLDKAGFVLSRTSGSHHIYIDAQGRRATVPVHAGKILHPKVVKSILSDAGWTVSEFIQRLAEV